LILFCSYFDDSELQGNAISPEEEEIAPTVNNPVIELRNSQLEDQFKNFSKALSRTMSGALAVTPISPTDTYSQEEREEDDPPLSKTESLNPFDDFDINEEGKVIPTSPSSSSSSPSIVEKPERANSSNQSEISDPLHSQLHSVASTSPRPPPLMQSIYQQYANKPFLEYKDEIDDDGDGEGGIDFDETSISLTDVMNFKLR
jgi:hypothetical protein